MNQSLQGKRRLYSVIVLVLVGMCLLAPWPGPQAVLHVFIVLGIAPVLRSPFYCALLAAVAGWLLETTLHGYPGMGGTALGNMICALFLWYSLSISPPEKQFSYYLQLVLAILLNAALVYFFVYVASGPHTMGYGWQWSLVSLPLWGPLAWRFYSPIHRRQ